MAIVVGVAALSVIFVFGIGFAVASSIQNKSKHRAAR
jgi:hypothetical protein